MTLIFNVRYYHSNTFPFLFVVACEKKNKTSEKIFFFFLFLDSHRILLARYLEYCVWVSVCEKRRLTYGMRQIELRMLQWFAKSTPYHISFFFSSCFLVFFFLLLLCRRRFLYCVLYANVIGYLCRFICSLVTCPFGRLPQLICLRWRRYKCHSSKYNSDTHWMGLFGMTPFLSSIIYY